MDLKEGHAGIWCSKCKNWAGGDCGKWQIFLWEQKKSLNSYVKYVEIEVICNYTKLFVVFTNQKFLAIDTAERF